MANRLRRSCATARRDQRRRIQFVFQNPDASLNPRARIGTILARPLEMFGETGDVGARVAAALADVRLDGAYARRFPDELSGVSASASPSRAR